MTAQSKSETAYRWVRERISRQDFTPGYRLVLGTIANELDMSVVPVREAIRQLEAEGLVTFERNVGAQVAMVDQDRYSDSMQALSLLEAAATALAAPQLTAKDLREARELNGRLTDCLDPFDPYTFTTLNQKFHAKLYLHCPNVRMVELVEAEWARLGHLRDSIFTFVPERAQVSVTEHAEIVQQIENGAPISVIEQLVRQHRAGTLQAFLTHQHSASPNWPVPDHPTQQEASRD